MHLVDDYSSYQKCKLTMPYEVEGADSDYCWTLSISLLFGRFYYLVFKLKLILRRKNLSLGQCPTITLIVKHCYGNMLYTVGANYERPNARPPPTDSVLPSDARIIPTRFRFKIGRAG
jgi:hypothetical protein